MRRFILVVTTMGLSQAPARQAIHVVAQDFAFQAPDSIRASEVTLEFTNKGQRDHELIVGLLRPGIGAADIAAAHQKGLNFRQAASVYLDGAPSGMLFAAPGTSSPARFTFPVTSGRSYLLLCQLRDSLGMPQHAALGMFKVVRVQ